MRIGIIINSNDPETVWNAFRFGVFSIHKKDAVTVFLLGKGVESHTLDTDAFRVTEQMEVLTAAGGVINA